MQNLKKRLSALEQCNSVSVGPIFVRFVRCGTDDKMERIQDGPLLWTRLPNETEQDFKNRVKSETPLPLARRANLFFCL